MKIVKLQDVIKLLDTYEIVNLQDVIQLINAYDEYIKFLGEGAKEYAFMRGSCSHEDYEKGCALREQIAELKEQIQDNKL